MRAFDRGRGNRSQKEWKTVTSSRRRRTIRMAFLRAAGDQSAVLCGVDAMEVSGRPDRIPTWGAWYRKSRPWAIAAFGLP
jgi:hypothetical protein